MRVAFINPYIFFVNFLVKNNSLRLLATLPREQGLDASSASVIETVRLAQTLAAIRGRQLPDLVEINEAIRSVLCFGDAAPMAVIYQQLIVHETLGAVPDEAPNVPLQQDVQREQKRLRMPLDATLQPLELDLRKPTDLQRSQLLYRLDLLGVPWGKLVSTRSKGTFRETWQLAWQPEFVVRLIERAAWGNTVLDAAVGYAKARATGQIDNAPPSLPALSALLRQTLLAELPEALALILQRLQDEAAVANDLAIAPDDKKMGIDLVDDHEGLARVIAVEHLLAQSRHLRRCASADEAAAQGRQERGAQAFWRRCLGCG